VLGGSISDAMLPLATVQSQSPPLRASATGDDAGDQSAATTPDGEKTGSKQPPASSSGSASAPAAEASPTPTPSAAQ